MAAPRFAPIEFGDGTRIDLDTGAIDWGGAALDAAQMPGSGDDVPARNRRNRRGRLSVRLATAGDPAQCAEALPAAWKRIHTLYGAPGPAKRHEAYQHSGDVQVRLDIDGDQGKISLSAESSHGFVFRPESSAAPHGWGLPRTPSNIPLGTPGGGNPYCKLSPHYSKAGDFVRNRLKRGIPISDLNGDNRRYGNIDWRWIDAKGAVSYLSWHGPAGRSMPFFNTLRYDDVVGAGVVPLPIATASPDVGIPYDTNHPPSPDNLPKRYLDNKIYLDGKLLLSFGAGVNVHGAAIRKIGAEYYVVAIVTNGLLLQSAKISLKNARKKTGTPTIDFDILGYDGLFDSLHAPIKWGNICFFFNQSATQAVGVIPVVKQMPQPWPTAPLTFYKTGKILVNYGSDGLVNSVASEMSPDYAETMTKTQSTSSSDGGYSRTTITDLAISGSCVDAILACDYRGDILQTARATITHTGASHDSWLTSDGGPEDRNANSEDTYSVTLNIGSESRHYDSTQSSSFTFSGDRFAPSPSGETDYALGQWSSASNSSDTSSYPFILYVNLRYGLWAFMEIETDDSNSNTSSGDWARGGVSHDGEWAQRVLESSNSPSISHSAKIKTSRGDVFNIQSQDMTTFNPYQLNAILDQYTALSPDVYQYYIGIDLYSIANAITIRNELDDVYYQLAIQPSIASLDQDNVFISQSLPPVSGGWGPWLQGTANPQHSQKIYHKGGVIDATVAVPITGANQKYANLGVV